MTTTPWYNYPTGETFGASGPGGSTEHGTDLETPLFTPMTAFSGGTITSIQDAAQGTSVGWGNAITWKLDNPINGVPYGYTIHLASIDPSLQIGQHINAGDLLGYTGGATAQSLAQNLATTPNPIQGWGNTLDQYPYSTGAHTEFGLSYGPQFGTGPGWVNPSQYPQLNPANILAQIRSNGLGGPVGSNFNNASPAPPSGITGGNVTCNPGDILCALQQLYAKAAAQAQAQAQAKQAASSQAIGLGLQNAGIVAFGIVLLLIGVIVLFVGHGGDVKK